MIKLHPESVGYIERVLDQYTETDELKIIKDPIVHIYAKEDTRNLESGELDGMIDALFCEYHIYDPKEKTVYKAKRWHDSLMFYDEAVPDMIKIFKDGSTLLTFKGKHSFLIGMTVYIRKIVD